MQHFRQEATAHYRASSLDTQPLDAEPRPQLKRPDGTDPVHAAYGPAQYGAGPWRIELGRAASLPREYREAKILMSKQCAPSDRDRRGHRQFGRCELLRELVFLENLRIGPASRAIELRYPSALRVPQLIDAVLVAVESEQTPIALKPQARGRV